MKNQTNNPVAAAHFGDRSYAEMLEKELRIAGFEVVYGNDADLLLTEADFLPFIGEGYPDRRVFIFLPPKVEKAEFMGADAVFPRIFSLAELERKLKNTYLELVGIGNTRESRQNKEPSGERCENRREKSERPFEISMLPDGRSVMIGGRKISLSSNEWILTDMLFSASLRGEAVSRRELSAAIGHDENENGNIVDVYICRLRRKLEIPFGRRFIFTVRGSGYSFGKLK